jgi:hypothetical protein
MKIVVFDLDETLGYFTEYGIFWDSLGSYLKNKNEKALTQSEFDDILDLFPEFLRPNIINILNYLKEKKLTECCHKMMIYTNNNGPREWANHIISYFEKKINFKLIDQIIAAFKINGKQIEISRTTHNKTHKDFIQCTKLPETAEICFIDDTFYPDMANDNVYYINIKPYYYDLDFEYMIEKFKESKIGKKLINNDFNFETNLMEYIKLYNYVCLKKNLKEYEIDKILGKHVIMHLKEFFKTKKNKSIRKKPSSKNNKTKKNN